MFVHYNLLKVVYLNHKFGLNNRSVSYRKETFEVQRLKRP